MMGPGIAQVFATAEDVDEAIKTGLGLRFPVYGPLEHADAVGIDLTLAISRNRDQEEGDARDAKPEEASSSAEEARLAGERCGIRTHDPRIKSPLLYH
jgi:3-hydroxyacyl-CoA dehydrogenase